MIRQSLYSASGNRPPRRLRLILASFFLVLVSPAAHAAHLNPAEVAVVPVGSRPTNVGVNPATNRVYVVNEIAGSVSVIDGTPGSATENSVVATVGVGVAPQGIAANPSTDRIYVVNVVTQTVSVIDGTPGSATENTIVATVFGLGFRPRVAAVNPVTNRIYVSQHGNGVGTVVHVIDGATNAIVANVSVPRSPHGVAVNPVTNRVYVSNLNANTVMVIDGSTNVLIVPGILVGSGPFSLALNPMSNRIYVANFFSNTVSVIDGGTNAVIATIPVPNGPSGPTVNSAANLIYVANQNSDSVTIIDGSTNTVILPLVAVGNLPNQLASNQAADRVYATNVNDNTVSVIADVPLEVEIDIKPGSVPNSINPRSKGRVPVAILTDASFDATSVDPSTVLFGPLGVEGEAVHAALEDVDGDLDTDMIVHFKTQETAIQCGDTEAFLSGETFAGLEIFGCDSVRTVGCK